MDREAFLDFLVRSVRDRTLTEQQATEFLRRFDAGEFDIAQMPTAIMPTNRDQYAALAALALLFRGQPSLSLAIKVRGLAALEQAFKERVRSLADILQRTGDVARWQSEMTSLISQNMLEARILGTGRLLNGQDLASLDSQINEQLAFLGRFADQIQISHLNGKPLSAAQVGARSEMYDRSRGEFYRGLTADHSAEGYVEDYIAVDDGGTCGPCLAAQSGGPYAVGDGPYPGDVCLGGGRCRCQRVLRYAPEEAAA